MTKASPTRRNAYAEVTAALAYLRTVDTDTLRELLLDPTVSPAEAMLVKQVLNERTPCDGSGVHVAPNGKIRRCEACEGEGCPNG